MEKRMKSFTKRMLAILISLILIVGAFPVAVYLAEGNGDAIITNGDFENGTTGFENQGAATFEVIAEPSNTSNHVLHAGGGGKFKQTITVEKNTDYIWTVRMQKQDDQQSVYFDVLAQDGTTNLITSVSHTGSAYSNMWQGRAAVDVNKNVWGTFKFRFNSGNNTSVSLVGDTWTANRDFYTDDWKVEKVPEPGVIINGDFEDGLKGFVNHDAAKVEVIADPDNASNHVLHVVGGDINGTAGMGSYYQTIAVEKNTNYVWKFRMKHVGANGATRIYVLPESSWTGIVTSVAHNGYGHSALDSGFAYVDAYNHEWVEYTVGFNSGENEAVKLYHNAWSSAREIYMDDWVVEKIPVPGVIINGDFEKGTKGYTNQGTATFETIPEPDNTTNNVLHLIGGGSYYQEVPVKKDTEYLWTFKMKDLGNTGSTRILVYPKEGTDNLISEIFHVGNGYSSLNDGTYAGVATYGQSWVTFTVKFNSGDNESVKLFHNTWADNREIYMDDWNLGLEVIGDVVNGDFENDLLGFTSDGNLNSFKVVADPSNPSNHVLEVGGTKAGTYWQDVKVEANTDYIWKFRAKRVSGKSGAEIVTVTSTENTTSLITAITKTGNGYVNMWNGSAFFEPYGGQWVNFEVAFNSGENTVIRIGHNAGSASPSRKDYMDDWSISKPLVPGELLNGNFDEKTKYYENENAAVFEAITDPTNGNNTILHAGGGGKFNQTIAVTPDTNYVWSFKMKSLDTQGNVYADVVLSNGTIITGSVSHVGATYATMYNGRAAVNTGANWATFRIRFNSGSNTTVKLQIDTWAANRDRYFDDWTLKVAAGTGEFLNSDFESTDLSMYEYDRYVAVESTTEDVHGGNGAAIVTKDETLGSGYFYQSISVEKNTDYIWRFWVKFNNSNTPVGAQTSVRSRIDGDKDSVVEPSFDFHRIRFEDYNWHQYEVFFSSGDLETIDLMLVLYAANAKLATDDWTLEKVGPTKTSDVLIDVDFEHENMGCHEISKPCWTVTDEDYHGGTHSIKYDGSSSNGPTDLLYLDEYGIIADTVKVTQNTKYRFSFWYKGEGDRLDMANVTFKLYSGGSSYHCTNIYINEDTEWKYAEHIFDSGDKTGFRLLMQGMILGSRKFKVYIDDIKLEKINVGVTDTEISPDTVVCEDEDNIIPAESKTTMTAGYSNVQKLTLTPYGIYNFKVSYTATGANGKIGIATDENGTPLTADKSILSISDTNGQSESKAFTIVAPEDGIVYLVTSNDSGSIEITDLIMYSQNPTPAIPVDKVILKNPTSNDKTSIWDQEFEFDFDWNTEYGDFEEEEEEEEEFFDVEPDFEFEIEPEEEEEEIDEVVEEVTGKKYQRVKKRKLISRGTPGISTTIIVLICVGAAVILGAIATFVTIFIVRKKKRKA